MRASEEPPAQIGRQVPAGKEYGLFFGMYTPVFITDSDTLRIRQYAAVDFDCYPGDTLSPGKKYVQRYSFQGPRIRVEDHPEINAMEKLWALDLREAALEYKMDLRFDNRLPQDRAVSCGI